MGLPSANTQFIENLVDPVTSVFIVAAYLIIVVTIIIIAYSLRRNKLLLTLLLLSAIALFTFEPGFPSSAHDFSFFLGPIFEVAHGKTIFTTTSSMYGFISILVLGFLTQLHLFNPFYLPFLTWLLYILQYFLCFYIIYRSSRSIVLTLLGLFSILTVGYFSLFHLPNTFPQIGPMRWLPLIISLFLIQKYKSFTDLKLILLFSILSLWNIEAGIALFLSYAFTLFVLTMVGAISKRKVVSSIVLLAVFNLSIFIILDIIHMLLGRQTIDFIGIFSRLREFAVAGVAMIPMPWRTHFWLVLLIYFASIIYYFRRQTVDDRKLRIDKEDRSLKIENQSSTFQLQNPSSTFHHLSSTLLFSANLSLFASVYYIGRSHPHNLFNISLFPILNVFLLFGFLFKKIKNSSFYFLASIFLFIVFILFPGFNRKQAVASMIKAKFDRLEIRTIFKPELEEQVKRFYFFETLLIKESLPEDEVLILSVDDTYLYYLVDKKNLLLDNPQSGIASVSRLDLDLALKKAYKTCPRKIAADCSLFGVCSKYQTFNHEAVNIQKVLLESLEKSCKLEYKPIRCTNKLCIAVADKD